METSENSSRLSYLGEINNKKFIGGSAPHSHWLTRESLMAVLDELGPN